MSSQSDNYGKSNFFTRQGEKIFREGENKFCEDAYLSSCVCVPIL